jgi:choline-sulfatase
MAARSVTLSGQYNRTCTGGVSNVAYASRPGDVNMPEYPEEGRPHLKAPTLAEVLRDEGYATAAIGKWHIHSWPHDVGFEHYVIPRVHHCHSGQSFTESGGPEFVPQGFSVDYEAERVEEFIADRARRPEPFLLYYNISPPHCPVADAPERFLRMYDPARVQLRPNVDPSVPLARQDYWFKVYRYDFRHYGLHLPYADKLPEGYDIRALTAEYQGLVTWADEALGRMLGALDRSGLAEDTIVLFSADHGDNLGSHGLVQKGGPTEESSRIPWLIRRPGSIPVGTTSDAVASLVDVAPTLLGLARAPVPGHMHGQSLARRLMGRDERPHIAHAVVETGSGAAIRTPSRMCFVPFAQVDRKLGERATMLYDVAADPYQLRNLAADDEWEHEAHELVSLLREWDARTPWMA